MSLESEFLSLSLKVVVVVVVVEPLDHSSDDGYERSKKKTEEEGEEGVGGSRLRASFSTASSTFPFPSSLFPIYTEHIGVSSPYHLYPPYPSLVRAPLNSVLVAPGRDTRERER